MGVEGALSGEQKLNNLKIITDIIRKELEEVMRLTSVNMGKKYECHVSCKLKIHIIPNNIK